MIRDGPEDINVRAINSIKAITDTPARPGLSAWLSQFMAMNRGGWKRSWKFFGTAWLPHLPTPAAWLAGRSARRRREAWWLPVPPPNPHVPTRRWTGGWPGGGRCQGAGSGARRGSRWPFGTVGVWFVGRCVFWVGVGECLPAAGGSRMAEHSPNNSAINVPVPGPAPAP